jgi:hypothetical protein
MFIKCSNIPLGASSLCHEGTHLLPGKKSGAPKMNQRWFFLPPYYAGSDGREGMPVDDKTFFRKSIK